MNSKSIWRYGLPRPLAELYINHRRQSEPNGQWDSQIRLIEEVVRFLTFIAMANIASSEAHCTNKIKKNLRSIVTCNFGTVFNILKNSIDYLVKKDQEISIFCPELIQLRNNEAWKESIDYFYALRNTTSHDERNLPAELAQQYLDKGKEHFIVIMNEISFLHAYHMGHFVKKVGRKSQKYEWQSAKGGTFDELVQVVVEQTKPFEPPTGVPVLISPHCSVLVLAPMISISTVLTGSLDYFVWKKLTEAKDQFVYFNQVRFKDSAPVPLKNLEKEAVPIERYFEEPFNWHELYTDLPFTTESMEKLDGRYKIKYLEGFSEKSLIGSGGMGVVYKAKDKFGTFRAIKILNSALAKSGKELHRFQTEAKILKNITHKNIVRVYQYGRLTDEDESPYIEMEYLQGQNLEEYLETKRYQQQEITLESSMDIILQILEGLITVHQHNHTHRDLKPLNIFVCEDGTVKIIDFGIAKDLKNLMDSGDTTKILATQSYACEDLLRLSDKQSQIQADLHSLGLIWAKILGHNVFPIPTLRAEFNKISSIYERCVRRTHMSPYQSAEEMRADILHLKSGRQIDVPKPSRAPAVFEALLVIASSEFTAKSTTVQRVIEECNDKFFQAKYITCDLESREGDFYAEIDGFRQQHPGLDATVVFICEDAWGSAQHGNRRLFKSEAFMNRIRYLKDQEGVSFCSVGAFLYYAEFNRLMNRGNFSSYRSFLQDLQKMIWEQRAFEIGLGQVLSPSQSTIDTLKEELFDVGRHILGREILKTTSAAELSQIGQDLSMIIQAVHGEELQKIQNIETKISVQTLVLYTSQLAVLDSLFGDILNTGANTLTSSAHQLTSQTQGLQIVANRINIDDDDSDRPF